MSPEPVLRIRRVTPGDCRLLWRWANDPAVRATSFRTDAIPLAEHERWFAGRLADPACLMLVAEDAEGRPVGQIRFEPGRDGEAVLGFTVASDRRGRGFGTELLRLGCELLFAESDVGAAIGYVKPDNASSLRAFEKAGFRREGSECVSGQQAVRMVLARPAD
jgi:UDP-2,4-diacetamido-2,4,6-trideoxy-beta-L-altropyranose hydrolase